MWIFKIWLKFFPKFLKNLQKFWNLAVHLSVYQRKVWNFYWLEICSVIIYQTFELPDTITKIQNRYNFPADTSTTDGSLYAEVMPKFQDLYLKASAALQKELDQKLKGHGKNIWLFFAKFFDSRLKMFLSHDKEQLKRAQSKINKEISKNLECNISALYATCNQQKGFRKIFQFINKSFHHFIICFI